MYLNEILKLVDIKKDSYHVFCIDKKNGSPRMITSPSMNLKYRQQWILKNILNNIELDDIVHGFVKGKSIVTNAKDMSGKSVC